MYFIVNSTTVSITKSPEGLVDEGTQINVTCEADESNPTIDLYWNRYYYYFYYWYSHWSYLNGSTETYQTTHVAGKYNARKQISTLSIIASSSHNGKKYICLLRDSNRQMYSIFVLNVSG